MAAAHWPPEWWTNLVNPEQKAGVWSKNAFTDFLRQAIPFMDLFQWAYEYANTVVKVIPHQAPIHERDVFGKVKPLSGRGENNSSVFATLNLGSVGYDALKRQVLWKVNEYGGWQRSEASFDVPMMLPILMQLLKMLPWDVVGEFGPTGQELGQEAYTWVREAVKPLGISLPPLPGGAKAAQASQGTITIAAGTYSIMNGVIPYTFTLVEEETLAVGKLLTVDATSSVMGIDAIHEGDTFSVDFSLKTGQTVEVKAGKASSIRQGSFPYPATKATMLLVVRNPSSSAITLNFSSPLFYQESSIQYEARFLEYPDVSIDNRTVVIDEGGFTVLVLTAVDGGRDPRWHNSNRAALANFSEVFPTGVVCEWAPGHEGIVAENGRDEHTGSPTVVKLVIKNTSYGLALLPSWATLLLYNIPIIDLSQVVYEGLSEMVDSIYHHPPSFQKTVWTGGVMVEYVYYVYPLGGSRKGMRPFESLPTLRELRGNTLEVVAVLYSSRWDEGAGKVGRKPLGERTLLTKDFFTWEDTITFVEDPLDAGEGFNEERGDAVERATVFVSVQNEGSETLVALAGTYSATFAGIEFRCAVQQNIVLGEGRGELLKFRAVEDGIAEVDDGPATVSLLDGPLEEGLSWKVWDNYSGVAAVGSPGFICEDPAEHLQLEVGDELLPPSDFIDLGLPFQWEVIDVRQGTNYTPATPSTPLSDMAGELALAEDGSAVTSGDGTDFVAATQAQYTVRVKILPDEGLDRTVVYTPSGAYTTVVAASATLIAVNRGVSGVSVGDTATLSVSAGTLGVVVRSIIDKGEVEPASPSSTAAGDSVGREAEVEVILANESNTWVDMAEVLAEYNGELISLGGEQFVLDVKSVKHTLLPPVAELTYSPAVLDPISFSAKEIVDVEVHFGSSMFFTPDTSIASWALRWFPASEMDFIGEAFSAGGETTAYSSASQYLYCRLRYKERIDRTRVQQHWNNSYTEVAERLPKGFVPVAIIQYNARERGISIINLRNSQAVKMRVNACVWFVIQHLMMIPLQVI